VFSPDSDSVAHQLAAGFIARPDSARATALLDDALLLDGSIRMGVLSLLSDMSCGFLSHRSVSPDWISTSQLRIRLTGDSVVGPASAADGRQLSVEASMLRVGRTSAVAEGIVRLDATTIGIAQGIFQRLPFKDGNPEITFPEVIDHEPSPHRLGGSWTDAIGLQPTDPTSATVAVEIRPQLYNPLDVFHGGLLTTPMEQAAVAACHQLTGVAHRAIDLDVRYLAMLKVGTAIARPAVLDETPRLDGRLTVRVELHDEKRLGSVALIVCEPSGA